MASRLWAKVHEPAVHSEITASADTEDGKHRLAAWRYVPRDVSWIGRIFVRSSVSRRHRVEGGHARHA